MQKNVLMFFLTTVISATTWGHDCHDQGDCTVQGTTRAELEVLVREFADMGLDLVAPKRVSTTFDPYIELPGGEKFPLDSIFYQALSQAIQKLPGPGHELSQQQVEVIAQPFFSLKGLKNAFLMRVENFNLGFRRPNSTSPVFRAVGMGRRVGYLWGGLYGLLEMIEPFMVGGHFFCNTLQTAVLWGEYVNYVCEAAARPGLRNAKFRTRLYEALKHVYWQHRYHKNTFAVIIDSMREMVGVQQRFRTVFSTVYLTNSGVAQIQNRRLYENLSGGHLPPVQNQMLRSEFSPYWFALVERYGGSENIASPPSTELQSLRNWLQTAFDPQTPKHLRHLQIYELEVFLETYLDWVQDLWVDSGKAWIGDGFSTANLRLQQAVQLLRKTMQYWMFEDLPESQFDWRPGLSASALLVLMESIHFLAHAVLENQHNSNLDSTYATAMSLSKSALDDVRRLRQLSSSHQSFCPAIF